MICLWVVLAVLAAVAGDRLAARDIRLWKKEMDERSAIQKRTFEGATDQWTE